jgi:hypothetical protein
VMWSAGEAGGKGADLNFFPLTCYLPPLSMLAGARAIRYGEKYLGRTFFNGSYV